MRAEPERNVFRIAWRSPHWGPSAHGCSRYMTTAAQAQRFADKMRAKGHRVEVSVSTTPITFRPLAEGELPRNPGDGRGRRPWPWDANGNGNGATGEGGAGEVP